MAFNTYRFIPYFVTAMLIITKQDELAANLTATERRYYNAVMDNPNLSRTALGKKLGRSRTTIYKYFWRAKGKIHRAAETRQLRERLAIQG